MSFVICHLSFVQCVGEGKVKMVKYNGKVAGQEAMDALIKELEHPTESCKKEGYAVRRLQRQQNVWYHERYRALKTLLDQAKDRKDIPEYKCLWKELTGSEIEIYTKAYSKDKLFPPDHDQDKSAEFWFDYN